MWAILKEGFLNTNKLEDLPHEDLPHEDLPHKTQS